MERKTQSLFVQHMIIGFVDAIYHGFLLVPELPLQSLDASQPVHEMDSLLYAYDLLQIFSYLLFVFIKGITTYLCQLHYFRIRETSTKFFAMLLYYFFSRSFLFYSENITRLLSYLLTIKTSCFYPFPGSLMKVLYFLLSLFKCNSYLLFSQLSKEIIKSFEDFIFNCT